MAVKDPTDFSTAALARFRELMDDMGWGEGWAIDQLQKEIGQELRISRKSIEHWFDPKRTGIPTGQIFNVSDVFGIDAGWLAGQTHIKKTDAIRSGGALCPRGRAGASQGRTAGQKAH